MGEGATFCDLTQSYATTGGGIHTYLLKKRAFLDAQTSHTHLLIVPGAQDCTTHQGRHITVEIGSPHVPGNPAYRLLVRSKAVIRALRTHRPSVVECLDAYNLPWAALAYRRERPETVLVAGYRTDFPTVYIERLSRRIVGAPAARLLRAVGYRYVARLYRRFDGLYALNGRMADKLASLGMPWVEQLPLGVDTGLFHPDRRDAAVRQRLGVGPHEPLLVYAGRINREKQADVVFDAFTRLPEKMGATLLMIGTGNLRDTLIARAAGRRAIFPGYVQDRLKLASMLASCDIYVSAMAYETFGISIIEAQAAGLPVVGVASGAMLDRVPAGGGLLGPVSDAGAMADNIRQLWSSGRAREMGAVARRYVEANFSWRRTFDHLFQTIYPRARARNRARRGLPPA